MIDRGKHPILGVNVHAVDYEAAIARILRAACERRPCAVSALASHGVMTGYLDPTHRRRLNGLDLVVPDGQPVRWALRWCHGIPLPDRVYGPMLTLKVAEATAAMNLPVYFYGSTEAILQRLISNLKRRFPSLPIAGYEPSRFRKITSAEKQQVVERIKQSGARLVFVGLGCPRQEVWAYEYREALGMPILAVGAAFPFHAGLLPQAPSWMQRTGLEWLFRLIQEPQRLWRRTLLYPHYLFKVLMQAGPATRTSVLYPNEEIPEESYG